MTKVTVDDAVRAWAAAYDGMSQEEIDKRVLFTADMMKALAEGFPLSPERFAARTGVEPARVPEIFKMLHTMGLDFDAEGHLVGAALTLKPTVHRFRVNGNELYAWCSLDTLFLPGIIDATGEVESTCPVTGEQIQLTITPTHVTACNPSTTVLSIVLPGGSCSQDHTGPSSGLCSRMFFFQSRPVAESWVKDQVGVTIFSVEEAFELARVHWIRRKEQARARASEANLAVGQMA